MDVLEHADDDVALLRGYSDKDQPGKVFVIMVPAFEFLWSTYDDYLAHRRRSTRTRLRWTIRAAGTKLEKLHYYFGAIFPIAVAVHILKRKRDADSSDMRFRAEPFNVLPTAVGGFDARLARSNQLASLSVVAQITKTGA